MSYKVKALVQATMPKEQGQVAQAGNWSAGEIDWVDDEVIHLYQNHADVFTILGEINQALITGVAAVSGLSAQITGDVVKQVTFTLADVAQAVVNGTEYQSTKLFDFTKGRVHVLGVVGTVAQKTTSAIASTLHASSVGALAFGTAAASNVALTGAMVDLLPSTAFASSATINVAGTAVSAALAAAAQFDGTTTAKSIYLNTAFATTADVAADATQTISGTVTVTYIDLGAY